jgi:hypothetical protein
LGYVPGNFVDFWDFEETAFRAVGDRMDGFRPRIGSNESTGADEPSLRRSFCRTDHCDLITEILPVSRRNFLWKFEFCLLLDMKEV